MFDKLKKVCSSFLGGIVGFVVGIVIGPFAILGNFIETLKQRNARDTILALPFLIPGGLISFFIVGPLLGAMTGTELGIKGGLHTGILTTIAKELFNYNSDTYKGMNMNIETKEISKREKALNELSTAAICINQISRQKKALPLDMQKLIHSYVADKEILHNKEEVNQLVQRYVEKTNEIKGYVEKTNEIKENKSRSFFEFFTTKKKSTPVNDRYAYRAILTRQF